MAKHILLPDTYKDPATHAAILSALKPYEVPGAREINNPHTRWNLYKAWEDAGELLAHSRWEYNDKKSFDLETAEYLLSAYTDEEIERANTIIAGIVARQILEPKEPTYLRRIEFRKGGEVDVAIASAVAGALKQRFSGMELLGGPHHEAKKQEDSLLKRIADHLRLGRK